MPELRLTLVSEGGMLVQNTIYLITAHVMSSKNIISLRSVSEKGRTKVETKPKTTTKKLLQLLK